MNSKFSPLETEALKLILNRTINELGILQATLEPTQPYDAHFKCPKISISVKNQNIWKHEHFRHFLEYIIRGAVEELEKYGTFRALFFAAEELVYKSDERQLIPAEDRYLKSKIKSLNEELAELKLKLFDWKNPWEKVKWESDLKREEEDVKISCSNKERYFGKYMEANHEGLLQYYKMQKEYAEDKQQNIQWRIRLEDRCTREMQSFLTLYRLELDAEFERCILLQEELTLEKENQSQLLRIKTEQLIEDTETNKQLLISRAATARRFRRNYSHFVKKKEALLTVQTWWRAMLTTKEVLDKFRWQEKKKKK